MVGRIKVYSRVYPAIGDQLVEIARVGLLPEYSEPAHSGCRPRNYPYAIQDTEKIVYKLRKDVRAGIMAARERYSVVDFGQAISHPSAVVREKFPGRTPCADYRIVSDLRQINIGRDKEVFATPLRWGILGISWAEFRSCVGCFRSPLPKSRIGISQARPPPDSTSRSH